MGTDLIKYGIGKEYLPDWTVQEALREIYQNFEDYGEFEELTNTNPDYKWSSVTLSSNYSPEAELGGGAPFLRIGKSGKRGDSGTIGEHGEGLKMAAMVLLREGHILKIKTRSGRYVAAWYNDLHIGNCFCFEVHSPSWQLGHPEFIVEFTAPKEALEMWKTVAIDPEEIIFECGYGSIIKKNPGDVYVGGFFVANISGLTKAYNFPPKEVPLDRDRKVPREFDVIWAAGQILSRWEGTTPKDLVTMDARYLGHVSEKLAAKFVLHVDPVTGSVDFETDGVRMPQHIVDAIMQKPDMQKKVSKLRYKMSRKKKPTTILKDFRDRHLKSGPARIDLDNIIRKSKDWSFSAPVRKGGS